VGKETAVLESPQEPGNDKAREELTWNLENRVSLKLFQRKSHSKGRREHDDKPKDEEPDKKYCSKVIQERLGGIAWTRCGCKMWPTLYKRNGPWEGRRGEKTYERGPTVTHRQSIKTSRKGEGGRWAPVHTEFEG